MKRIRAGSAIGIVSIAALFGWATAVSAQTFSSGSNGTLGAFAPGANTTVTLPPDGVLNYTTVTIPAGVTVSFTPNAANTPVTMLAGLPFNSLNTWLSRLAIGWGQGMPCADRCVIRRIRR